MSHSILIIEDDYVVATNVSSTLKENNYEILGICDTGEEALKILENRLADLVIIDINLAGALDGIETANYISDRYGIPFIFLTANESVEALEKAVITKPVAYMAKPFDPITLRSTIKIAIYNVENLEENEKDQSKIASELNIDKGFFFIKTSKQIKKIRFEDILWIEAFDIYSKIKLDETSQLLGHSLKYVEQSFPSEEFIRVHRSYIANVRKIDAIEGSNLIIGKFQIPIGKTFRDDLMVKLSIL